MNLQLILMFVAMIGLMFFMQRSQKKQAEKRMESLNKLQKGYEVITIGGLYGTVDEVDTDKKIVVLDVDGVYLTFELTAIKTVLPLSEGIPAAAGVDGEVNVDAPEQESAIEEE
ncbi:preprotein translocase subunit YajC [Streptococcus panodentis]|uniref:Preprotein translocase subunit YajC n=1 Tax=Streptococcus panodentis TaxID=1581472 RepID=A0ABS5AZM1_9STRE|nr:MULTISPECIES: preprotein translocase subunit YajC [Streptococcus]KXT83540.1 Preprotein translocase subunit YajC [Streptococcus sp. DD11]MBP2622033.1 preprotein translocase subunit YajC [Streptococcus panodentis]